MNEAPCSGSLAGLQHDRGHAAVADPVDRDSSCKRRGFCPSCGAHRIVESAALLVDDVLPAVPNQQWVVTFPYARR